MDGLPHPRQMLLTLTQIIGGIISSRLALAANALHILNDTASLALIARRIAGRAG